MKSQFFVFCYFFLISFCLAAPRVVVSTASLVPESKVDVVFDSAMVAPEELGNPVEGLQIVPGWRGQWKWKSPEIAEFYPEESPAIGAKYEFRMAKGRKHKDGSPVPVGKLGEAIAEEFRAVAGNSPDRWSQDYDVSTGAWIVVFNDEVNAEQALPFLRFEGKGNQPVAATAQKITNQEAGWYGRRTRTWRQRGKTAGENPGEDELAPHVLKISPAQPLHPGKDWKLVIGVGLPNAEKNAVTKSDLIYQIGTIESFSCTNVQAIAEVDEPREIVFNFNQLLPKNLGEELLADHIVIHPKPGNLQATVNHRKITLTGDFGGFDRYEVSLRGPLKSAAGFSLANPINKKIQFKKIEPELSLPSDQQGQYAKGRRSYAIRTVNLSKISLRVKRLSGVDLIRAMQGYQSYLGAGHEGVEISPASPLPWALVAGDVMGRKEYTLDNPRDTSRLIEFRWDEVLSQKIETGALFVDATGDSKESKFGDAQSRRAAQAIVQLTDIGLAWKFTEREILVYAFSCSSGQPLNGVAITAYGEDAKELDRATTDEAGIARLPRQNATRNLYAAMNQDAYATAFDSSAATVGMWHFPVRTSYTAPPEKQRRAFLFTDRSVYRPGEKVRLKGIVRELAGNEIRKIAPVKADMVILDPAEKEIVRQEVKISGNGSFDFTHELIAGRLGEHTLRLEFPDDLARLARAEAEEAEGKKPSLSWMEREQLEYEARFDLPLRVEDFRRNAFEIKQSVSAKIAAAEIRVALSANYYQGQPVAAGKVKYYSRVTEANPYPERFRDFLFGNHRREDWQYWYHYFGYREDEADEGHTTNLNGETILSGEGKAEMKVAVPKSDFPGMRKVEVITEVTDANHQTLTTREGTTVHPASVAVGISRLDGLARAGQVLGLKFVAVDPEGKPYHKPLAFSATLTREVNTPVKTRNEAGETITRNDRNEELVSTAEVTLDPAASGKDGQQFMIKPNATGLHFLTVRGKDEAGHDFATVIRFHVYGTNDYPWQYEDGLRVKLVADKKTYRPGDTARVLVLSPIEGKAIVTVEREKILRSFTVDLKMDKPVVEIPVTDEDAPNAFVSVLVVKGADESARQIKEPQLRLGYCELLTEPVKKKLKVSLNEHAPSYRPGEQVELAGAVHLANGQPTAGAEVTLYAEDEGTLAVMGYRTPDPIKYFYHPRLLAVQAGTSFDTFLSEDDKSRDFFNKGFFVGGGGDLSMLGDPRRKNFDPCATWAATLITDAQGRFSHNFTLPDTLTRYRVIAVAYHDGAFFGHAESAIVAKKEVMLEAKSPRAANQGDLLRPQVTIQNASGTKGTWELRLVAHDAGGKAVCRATEGVVKTVELAPGEEKTVSLPVEVEATGMAMVAWQASPLAIEGAELTPALRRKLSDSIRTTFRCDYPMPILREVRFTTLRDGKIVNLGEKHAKELLAGRGTISIEFSRSRLSEAAGAADELLRYPYGCVEQTSSALLPWCSVDALREVVPTFGKKTDDQVKGALQSGVNRLLTMQLPDGSFSYWPGSSQTVDWATPYAGMAMVLARKAGAEVPPSAIDALVKSLSNRLRGMGTSSNQEELERYAQVLYTLALAGKPDISYQNKLADRTAHLTPTARGLLASAIVISAPDQAAARERARKILTAKSAPRPLKKRWLAEPNDALLLLAWLHVDADSQDANKALDRLLAKRSPGGGWSITWLNGWAMHALAECARRETRSEENITVVLKTNKGEETITLTKDQPAIVRSFPLGAGVSFVMKADKPTYVRTNVMSKPAILPTIPVANNGLAVDRSYQLVNGDGSMKPLENPKPGDLIRVTLRVTLPKDDVRYLVVDDPLPAVFEAIHSDFSSQSAALGIRTSEQSWNVSHSELRDDRAVFFLDHVWKAGTCTLSYLARCTTSGDVFSPSAKAEMMYDPDNTALSASRRFSAN